MELTKNKIILIIISWIIWFFIIIILLVMMFSSKNSNSWWKQANWDFSVWIVWETPVNLEGFIDWFNKFSKSKWTTSIKNFSNYEDYSLALTYALASGTAPDVFVLNNNEKNSLFENQVLWISPKIFSPDFFRREYKSFVVEQLISKTDKDTEFVIWLPVWYETLWIFYNKNIVNSSDLKSFSSLKNSISKIKNKNSRIIPIAIWNWTTLDFSEDIATQFLVSKSWARSISNISKREIQTWLSDYLSFWDMEEENAYNSRYTELKKSNQDAVYLFREGEVWMVVWYPKLINKIVEKWGFSRSNLLVSPFIIDSKNWATLVNYNYFVINKDSKNLPLAEKFISYLSSQDWVENYLNTFPYYLPVIEAFEENLSERKIHSNYNIKLSDFFNENANYTSFDKWIKIIFDKSFRDILDFPKEATSKFFGLQKSINCKTSKIVSQDNFWVNCE